MPCCFEGNSNSSERKNRFPSKRSVGQNTNSCCVKDHQVCKPASSNPEERYTIFTLLSLGHDSYWKLAPFLPAIQDVDQRKRLTSGATCDKESIESLSPPPTIVYWLNEPNEKNINMLSQTDAVKPGSDGRSLGGSSLRQPRNGKNFSNLPSTLLPCYLVSDKSSRPVSDSLAVGSNFLADGLPKADKSKKRSPRKKGKKKGKQYRRDTRKKISSASEIHSEENMDAASPLEIPQNNVLVSKSETSSSSSSLLKEVSLEKDGSENNNEYGDCPTTLMSSTSCSDEMDDSEPTASSREIACEGFNCGSVAYLNDGSNAAEASEVNGSTFSEKHGYVCLRERSYSCHKSLLDSICDSNAAAVDSFLDGWNSDISGNYSDGTGAKLIVKDESGCDYLQGGISMDLSNLEEAYHSRSAHLSGTRAEDSNGSFSSSSCWSKDITDGGSNIERLQCSSEACSSNDFSVIPGRRGRRSRKMSSYTNSNGSNRTVNANIHNRSGKNRSFSVWQKVQKLNNKECISRARHVNATSLQDKSVSEDSKESSRADPSRRLKQNQSGDACKNHCSDDAVKTKSSKIENDAINSCRMVSKSINKKQMTIANQNLSSSSKQATPNSTKCYYTAKNSMLKAQKNHSLRKGGSLNLKPVNNTKQTTSGLLLSCVTSQQPLITPTKDTGDYRENQSPPTEIDKVTPNICSMGLDLCSQTASKEASSFKIQKDSHCYLSVDSEPISSEDLMYMSGDHCFAHNVDNQCVKLEIENPLQETSKLDSSIAHASQKWVPVGKKGIADKFHLDSSRDSGVKTSVLDSDNSNSAKVEVSRNIADVFALTGGPLSSSPVAQYVHQSSVEDRELNSEEKSEQHSSGKFIGLNGQASTRSETDLDKIRKAVSDAYEVQRTVEGIKLVTGTPLADFERFIYCASPVLGCSPCIKSCNSCSQQWIGDDLSCSHQIPNISLKSIWQWYEEPGCYGLEVKAQDFHKSKRLWNDRSEFTAYFVPYLSAVQLFSRPKSNRHGSSNEESGPMDKMSKPSSFLSSIPIFSMLLPQPSNERNTLLSSLSTDQLFKRDDGELIFEYFESEQPPWRRPLFEKIKELISGATTSDCKITGDPKCLEYLNLHDLHPASWYCVAWYPIYRIPDGNFRAAFLTYHSLGHLVRRSSSSNIAGLAHVVCPVVGLQSYNDKGEWWFQMRDSDSDVAASTESPCSSPSEVVRERLRTLNRTALVIARANVPKGGRMCANSHPDYEFFQSRYW